jgi:AcrR family transcriptional regulator
MMVKTMTGRSESGAVMEKLTDRRKSVTEQLMRDAIRESAESVLAEVGFAELTMGRVAKRAGVSKGTLYNYFRDKDALILEVADAAFAPLHARLDELFANPADIVQTLFEAIRSIFRHIEDRRGLGQVFCGGELSPAVNAEFRRGDLRQLQNLTGVFQRAQERGLLRASCCDPAMAARMLLAALRGLVEERMRYVDDCPPLEREIDFFNQFVVQSWFKEKV